jgi:hypothetical protein
MGTVRKLTGYRELRCLRHSECALRRVPDLVERTHLELVDALGRHAELDSEIFELPGFFGKTPGLENASLAVVESFER